MQPTCKLTEFTGALEMRMFGMRRKLHRPQLHGRMSKLFFWRKVDGTLSMTQSGTRNFRQTMSKAIKESYRAILFCCEDGEVAHEDREQRYVQHYLFTS